MSALRSQPSDIVGLEILTPVSTETDSSGRSSQPRVELAADALANAVPELSARRGQRSWTGIAVAVVALTVVAVCAAIQPRVVGVTLIAIMIVAYATTLVHRIELMRRALKRATPLST